MKTALLLGSTGLIGSELVERLQAAPHYRSVVLLNRRPSGYRHSKISEKIIDFDAPDLRGVAGDDLFCALGTTIRKAGSQAALRKVDYEYPALFAARLKDQGVKRIALVSSVGANAKAASFYLRTKGQLEETIVGLGFEQTVIVRPSVLIGQRTEFRLGEEVAILLLKLFSPVMLGGLRKYKGIKASTVAAGLVRAVNPGIPGVRIIESDRIHDVE